MAVVSKQIFPTAVDLMLNKIATGTTVVYTNMTVQPTTVASISNVLATRTILPNSTNPGVDWTIVSGVSATIKASSSTITAGGTGTNTASCVIIHDGTNILFVDKGTTQLTSGQVYLPSAITYTFGQDAT